MTRRRQKGMTLIEVLVAMAILATVAGSVLVMTGQSAQIIVASEERLLARIVADNAMALALARQTALEEGFAQAEVELGGRTWKTAKTTARTGVDDLYRIEIAVSLGESTQILTRVSTLRAAGDEPQSTKRVLASRAADCVADFCNAILRRRLCAAPQH